MSENTSRATYLESKMHSSVKYMTLFWIHTHKDGLCVECFSYLTICSRAKSERGSVLPNTFASHLVRFTKVFSVFLMMACEVRSCSGMCKIRIIDEIKGSSASYDRCLVSKLAVR